MVDQEARGRDPLGELTDEQFDALSPVEKGQRTREAGKRLQAAQEAGETQGGGDADAPPPDADDADEADDTEEESEEEEPAATPLVTPTSAAWITADAHGRPIG